MQMKQSIMAKQIRPRVSVVRHQGTMWYYNISQNIRTVKQILAKP